MTETYDALRMKRMRATKSRDGWKQVNVLVPTKADADDIRSLAAGMRKLFRNHPAVMAICNEKNAEQTPVPIAKPLPTISLSQPAKTQLMTRNGQGRMPISLKGFPPLLGKTE